MNDRIPITAEGHGRLRDELKRLKSVDRPEVSKEIGVAREHGDLKENAEYHAAKEKQGMIEARIALLEDHLARAEIIDVSRLSGDRVVFGASVQLLDVDNDTEVTYRIVGEDEADLDHGSISVRSPIARALIGKEVGDTVVMQTGRGRREYEVLEVSFEG
jgi:transcription elongation factor GreA